MTVDPDFVLMECCVCGVLFGVSSKLRDHRAKTGAFVWCPNGHKVGVDKEGGK